ncbi:MAG: autotransporter-associated beta strand repeat-containing protein [Kiritimatiellia bacterium]
MEQTNMKLGNLLLGAMMLAAMPLDAAQLTYIGVDGGSWLDADVWQDESGATVTWSDGATAVLGDVRITLPGDVSAEGIEWTTTTKRTLTGAGALTLGKGGIVNCGKGEINFSNSGGIHLAVDQTWHTVTTELSPLICLDGNRSLTTEEGVTLTVTGRTVLRWNAKAELPDTTTIRVTAPAILSMASDSSAKLGSPALILDGTGSRASFGGMHDGKNCTDGMLASTLYLRNGASITLSDYGFKQYLGIPRIVVDGTQTEGSPSQIAGSASPELTISSMTFEVAEGCELQFSAGGVEGSDVSAAFVKTGPGKMTLVSGQRTFTGGVDVKAGTLEIAGASAAGTGPVTAADGTTVVLPASGTLPNAFAGAGTFEKRTAGELTLAGSATEFSGQVVVSAGSLRAGLDATAGGEVVPLADAVWTVLDDASFETDVVSRLGSEAAGSVWAGAGTALTVQTLDASSSALSLGAEKGGLLRLSSLKGTEWAWASPGDVRIDSLGDYSGSTIAVTNGVLLLASPAAIPEGCVVETSGSGIVQFDTTENYDASKVGGTRCVAFADGSSAAVDTSASSGLPPCLAVAEGRTFSVTALTGEGDFYKEGDGTLELAGAEDFAGRIFVLGGTLRVTGAAGANTVVVSNGLFTATGSGTVLRNSFEVWGGTLQAENGASLGAGELTLAAAGTICVTNGGTFGWSELALGAGTMRIAAGGIVTTALKTESAGTLVISDGGGLATPLTLAGGTLRFDADTTLQVPITQTAATILAVAAGKTATLAGKYTNNNGKCRPSGPGLLVFAGGGEFPVDSSELFVQGGSAAIEKNDFTFSAYFGVEGNGRQLIVRDGAKVLAKRTTTGRGLHVGTASGVESVFEVGPGGEVEFEEGFHISLGQGNCAVGRLRVAAGGVFKYGSRQPFYVAYAPTATASVEVVGGVFVTSKGLTSNNGTTFSSVRFEDAAVTAAADLTLVGEGISCELRGTNTLEIGAYGVTLGPVWTGAGSLAVTGKDGTLRATASMPDWTGTLALAGANLELAGGVALANESVTVETGSIGVVAGTASFPSLGGAAAKKTGDGTLVVSSIAGSAFDLTVAAGGVQVAPGGKLQPAGVPAVWLDASVESSFTKSGTSISRWSDRRSGAPVYADYVRKYPLYNATGFDGRPFVDFGVMADSNKQRAGDDRMLQFNALQTNIRTVFWMVGSRNGGGFLLGDSQQSNGKRCFHRGQGADTTFGAVASDPLWDEARDRDGLVKGGTTWINGMEVDGTKTGLGGAWDLVSWRLSEADDAANLTPCALWLASCYNATDGRLNGGQDLAEILIYTNRLTDAEVRATQRYLADKWMPTNAANRILLGTLTMRGADTSFTVDAGIPAYAAHVVVEGRGVTVRGVATAAADDVVLGDVAVAAGGEWNAANFRGVTVTNLVFAENAVVGATVDESGHADTLTVLGSLSLPSALLYSVARPEEVTVRRTEILRAATLTGAPAWTRAAESSAGAAIAVDAAANALVLKGLSGTMLYLR